MIAKKAFICLAVCLVLCKLVSAHPYPNSRRSRNRNSSRRTRSRRSNSRRSSRRSSSNHNPTTQPPCNRGNLIGTPCFYHNAPRRSFHSSTIIGSKANSVKSLSEAKTKHLFVSMTLWQTTHQHTSRQLKQT